jgi:TolB protein
MKIVSRSLALGVACGLALVSGPASAQGSAPPPDDALLGTVEVDGSGSGVAPLPKLAFVPLAALSKADRAAQGVVRHDLELSGQYDVIAPEKLPDSATTREAIVDLGQYRAKTGAEVVVRVFADAKGSAFEVVGEVYDTRGAAPTATTAPTPLFRATETAKDEGALRLTSHAVTDKILGALTGRPGGFVSHLVFTRRDGTWQSLRTIDPDGENVKVASPTDATIMSPTFGPGGVLYYVMSRDFAPFRVAAGPMGTILPIDLRGSVMGIAISSDYGRAALTVMRDGKSSIFTSDNGKLTALDAAPLAHHPTFGPLGKVAYVGGTPVQRVHVDGKAVSPAGFMASAPTFCDTTQGLWIVFTVEVVGGAELVATDTSGGNMRRLTQRQGENRYPACSPDGRLVAFFSTTKSGSGPGLYVMPVGRPWLAKKVSSELGQGLRWERLPSAAAPQPAPR